MAFTRYDLYWALHRFGVEVEEKIATGTFVMNDAKKKRCANLSRTSVNYYVVSVCDYNSYLILQYKFPTCKKAVEYLQEYFSK